MRLSVALPLLLVAHMSAPLPTHGQSWVSILDAKATGWRGYQKAALPEGWRMVDGALTRVSTGGDIVYGAAQYADFEFEFEWKVRPKGNSGVFYRAGEATEHIYENATEYQILDNIEHPDGRTPNTVAASNYALYGAAADAVRPVGEWNTARIVATGSHIEHWLNGRKVVTYELWSPEWEAKVKGSKFNQWPSYGRATRGMIGLQDHGDWVAYRNMRIKTSP